MKGLGVLVENAVLSIALLMLLGASSGCWQVPSGVAPSVAPPASAAPASGGSDSNAASSTISAQSPPLNESAASAPNNIAAASTLRVLNKMAIDLIKHFESWKPNSHEDPLGYCSIGYGHLIAKKPCADTTLGKFATPLTIDDGLELLAADTKVSAGVIRDNVKVRLDDNQHGALASFAFNLGADRFADSTLLRLLNGGEYELAAKEMPRWVKGKGKVLPGLVVRRACEQSLFFSSLRYDAKGEIDRDSCTTLGIAQSGGDLIDIEVGE